MGRGRRWLLVLSLLAATACRGGSQTAGPPAPSTSPVADLAATAAAPAFQPANVAAERSFHPAGVWFLDGSEGWVIGGGCSDGRCLLHTRDGGRRWERVAVPVTAGASRSGGEVPYVSDVRFADARNGWLFDRDLWSTHDGGATWTAAHLGGPVLALETSAGRVFALVGSCRLARSDCHGPVRLFESAVGADGWRPVLDVDAGSGSGRHGRLVVSGRSVFALVDRSGTSWATARPAALYARTAGGRWERRSVPSSCFRAVAAAAGPRQLNLWCQTGDGAGGSAPHEFWVSRRGGGRWTRHWSDRSVYFDPVAVTSEGRFLAASVELLLVERPDGNRDWIRFDASGEVNESILRVVFPSARDGFVLTAQHLYRTRDAGESWEPVPFDS